MFRVSNIFEGDFPFISKCKGLWWKGSAGELLSRTSWKERRNVNETEPPFLEKKHLGHLHPFCLFISHCISAQTTSLSLSKHRNVNSYPCIDLLPVSLVSAPPPPGHPASSFSGLILVLASVSWAIAGARGLGTRVISLILALLWWIFSRDVIFLLSYRIWNFFFHKTFFFR